MSYRRNEVGSNIFAGVAAGLAGACVLMAASSFDKQYAPKTVPEDRPVAGSWPIELMRRATNGRFAPTKRIECQAAVAVHLGCGSLIGLGYALCRGHASRKSVLTDGILVGTLVYVIGSLGLRPALRWAPPIWRQRFPQIAGEMLRHAIFGVATAAAMGVFKSLF
jgi:uncharacterized membrane protein YagU involved in acid resistance